MIAYPAIVCAIPPKRSAEGNIMELDLLGKKREKVPNNKVTVANDQRPFVVVVVVVVRVRYYYYSLDQAYQEQLDSP